MSLTYVSALLSFAVAIGILHQDEADTLNSIIALAVPLALTLYGRYRAGGIHWSGIKHSDDAV